MAICILLALFQFFIYKMQSFKLEIGRHFRNDISNKGVLPQTPPLKLHPSPLGTLGAERKLIHIAQLS